ncbi:MAG: nitroreductase family protein [Candidatus Heimdallarchaeota archaeon]|nr:nitroreductase family protein [Candidatus Heimdallarchaeota archaeon]
MSKSVMETLAAHVSIREFIDKAIPDELLQSMLETACRSPTSSNLQAYSLIVIRKPDIKRQLAVLAGNQNHIETCDTFVAICADNYRLEKAAELHDKSLARNLENSLVSTIDAALVGMSLSSIAESFNLGTVMIGGIRNHPLDVAKLLKLPKGVFVVYGLCIGYPDWEKVKPQKPRLPIGSVIHYNEYDSSCITDNIHSYDTSLALHYREQGRISPDSAWSGIIAKNFSEKRRPHLREELETMGFVFD